MQQKVRQPSVAEEFYPSDPGELKALLSDLFNKQPAQSAGKRVKAIIVPHAPYRYGGEVSATAFASVSGRSPETVILMGNAHAYLFDGIAIDSHDAWNSPLGNVPIDRAMSQQLTALSPKIFHELDIAHHCDHVLEIQLPYLQHVLNPGFSILPILFGQNHSEIYRSAADSLIKVMTGKELIVASTDLSHYPSYRNARNIDNTTLEHMSRMDIAALEHHEQEIRHRRIPGATSAFCSPEAVKTLLEIARRRGWKTGETIYRNSGDATHDDRMAVVGYGALAFYEF